MGRRRPSYLFLYFFCVVLLRSASLADDYEDEEESVVFEPPLLFPEDPELIISSGETVQLRCESKRPIKWTIPKYKIIDKEGLPDISVNFTRNAASEYSYVSHLQVYNAETLDTGYYYCRFAENSNLAAVEEVASVYVYVNDSNILLASNARSSFIHLTPIQYQEVTLPCKPTSPDVIVNLEKDNEIVEQDSFKKYDPKLGFKFSHVNINDGGFYSCNAFRGDITEKLTISLKVLPHTNTVPKPQIDDKNAIHVGVGSAFLLNCTVQMELSVIFNLEWVTPNQHANETGRLEIGDAESTRMKYFNYEYNLGSKQLIVHNATSEDQGYYKCIVVDHTHKNNSAERFVRIYEANITYINLTVQGNVSEISTKAGKKSIQWVVHINAHPSPELTWFGPREKEIHNISTKYEIQTGPTQTMLKINDIDIDDAGQYQLRAIQGERKVVKNLTLIVYDSPIADLISPMYYTYGEIHKVNCSVIGYPLPNVTWHFKGCGNSFQNCDIKDSIIEESQYEEIQLNGKGKKSYFLEMRANESGYLTCLACNSVGCGNDTKEVFVTDVQDGFDSFVIPPEPVVGDNVTLSCGASVYNYTDPISWYKYNPKDDAYENITTNEVYKVIQHTTQFSRKVDIQINKINMTHAGIYVCKVPKISDDYKVEEKHVNVTVQKIHSPVFWKSNMNGSTYYVDIGAKVEWKCSVKGVPKPLIIWYKDDEPLQVEKSNMELSKDNQTLKITFANVKDKGKYSCKVSNKGGRIEGSVYLEFNHKTDYGLLIGFLVFGTFLSVVIIFLILKNNKEKKKRKELMYAGLANFEDGALENINPELGVDDQAELLPYDKKWEFPREKLKLGKQLGSGAFGVVMKGDACGIVEGEAVTTVAVKMVKRNAEYTHIKALASELKIMVHLGKHLNVVNLLGACTKNLTKRELLVIVEYCRFGNLQNYLLRHREDFIDQIDPITGKVIPDIMDNKRHSDTSISKAREAGKADPRIKYAALSFSTSASSLASQGSVQDYRAAPVVKVDSSPCNGATGQTLNTDMSFVSMSPSGEECGVTGGSSNEPDWRTNYRGDYGRRDVRPICTTDLICWAFQVARGIDYLASRRVLHGDLAARNILLAEDNIVKICDFGLAKSMYKSDNYKKKGDGPLPVKWMAIESIRDRVFSTQSDVWSFGIVLWEFFSLARTPYPGMEADEKLYNKLIAGYRMEKPQFATEEIYTVMQDCWKAKPSDRPSFSELTEKLGGMLEDSVKRHYIELNSPYMMMNTQQPETTDYLGMMSEPSYANAMREITTDSPQRDYVNAPKQPENAAMDYMTMNSPEPPSEDGAESESGYLCMRSGSMGSGGNPTVIFSPRPNSTKAFDFDVPSSRNPSRLSPRIRAAETKGAEGPELSPMLPANNINKGAMLIKEDSLDSGVGSPSSYFNPTYRSLPNTNGNLAQNNENSGINYVNIPQSKARQSDISSGFQSDGEVSPLPVKNSSSFEMPMEIAT